MKLRIEMWVEKYNPFSESAMDLFSESVQCYKMGSYSSAFIMSYLAFKLTIRDRIIDCNYGSEVAKENPLFWENDMLRELKNDDKWEEKINTIVIASCVDFNHRKDIGILNFTNVNQAKTDYEYWKNKRNACAHGKKQLIDSSTVEMFWNYLIDNLGQFYVLGGKEYLLREMLEIYKYYEFSTIVNCDRIPSLVNDISTVYQKMCAEFFRGFFEEHKHSYAIISDSNKSFWDLFILLDNESIVNGFIECISEESNLFFKFYEYYSCILEYLVAYNSKFIIDILSKWLKEFYIFYPTINTFWKVFIVALKKYDKQVQVNEIVNSNTSNLIKDLPLNQNDISILNKYDVLKSYLLNVYNWYFNTDSESQYDNFCQHHNDFSNIEKLFSVVTWDIELLDKIYYALSEFENSFKGRTNTYRISNGYDFINSIKKIVDDNISKMSLVNSQKVTEIQHLINQIK